MRLLTRAWLLAAVVAVLLSACGSPAASPTPMVTAPAANTAAPAVPSVTAAASQPPPASTAPPAAGAREFQNPVIKTNFPDPFLLQDGDTWYAYATNGSGKNVQLATSTDLMSWSIKPDAMPGLAAWVKTSSPDVWAPEVIKIGEQYVLYYTARDKTSGKQCVGAAVSSSPQGKFRDSTDHPLVCQTQEGGTIDADPFRDGDKLYLFFKNDGNCCAMPTYIYVQELAADGLSLVDQPERLLRNDVPWEGNVIEAPTMYKENGNYFLFYSANNYAGFEYAVGYATCQSVTGPCQDAPENPILKSEMDQKPFVVGPGHQAIIEVDGQDWIIYHAWQILPSGIRSDTRQVWMDRLDWKDGKPLVEGPTTGPQPEP